MTSISSDSALVSHKDDKFNRYPFAKRIANTILNRKDDEGLVLGIYGAWGEGKTTVLNFIHHELTPHYPRCLVVRFNPWRFTEEELLIREFYNSLALEVVKSLPKQNSPKKRFWKKPWIDQEREPLKKRLESFGEKLTVFGLFLDIIGIGEAAKAVGEKLSSTTLDEVKKRLNTFLQSTGRRLVIIIDDIDRLDKDEVHAIFRLVKLNADFKNTIYVLSFDEEMVSKMVGQKYGGDKDSGLFFLEKIIQVPLYIPKAYPNDLRLFALTKISDLLSELDMMPSDNEQREYAQAFDSGLFIRIDTPRIAVRYANTLYYSLPILKGETNIVDLMLIEGVRVLYPNYYDLIKQNSDLFLEGYRGDSTTINLDLDKEQMLKESLKAAGAKYSENERLAIRRLLTNLFPRIKEALGNQVHSEHNLQTWYRQKRICSTKHFHRYFGYSIAKGDLSDREFDEFIANLGTMNDQRGFDEFIRLTKDVDHENLITKLRMNEATIGWQDGKRVCIFLCKMANSFDSKRNFFAFFSRPLDQAAIYISRVVFNHKTEADIFTFSEEVIKQSCTLEFAYEVEKWLVEPKKDSSDEIFTQQEKAQLFLKIKNRAIDESQEKPFFVSFPELSYSILSLWGDWISRDEVNSYLKMALDLEPKYANDLIRVFTPTIYSSAYPDPIKKDFKEENYNQLKRVIDVHLLMKCLETVFPPKDIQAQAEFKVERSADFTDIELVRQFNHWYQIDNSTSAKTMETIDGK